MLFQAAAVVFAAFGILIKHPTTGVAKVLLALLHICLFVLVALKRVADHARLQATHDLFEVTAKDALERASRQKHLLFGSPFTAARLNVNDLYMPKEEWSGVLQIRDGVAIDRDSEKARDRLKYDFEVVPASAMFDLEIVLENATKRDVQLLCVGLSEFVHGFGVIGGKRSRGLGVAELTKLQVSALELFHEGVKEKEVSEGERKKRLRNYLIGKEFSRVFDNGSEFLEEYISSIFE